MIPSLIETMRVVDRRIPLLRAHVQRYRSSADALDYAIADWSTEASKRAAGASDCVLRAQINCRGDVSWTMRPLPETTRRLVVDASRVVRDTSGSLVQYKNTQRGLYQEAAAEAKRLGVDHVMIRSGANRLTETSIHTLLFESERRWWTPPLSDGLLAGVVRSELVRRGVVGERSLDADEALRVQPQIALCNAVTGVVRAHWAARLEDGTA